MDQLEYAALPLPVHVISERSRSRARALLGLPNPRIRRRVLAIALRNRLCSLIVEGAYTSATEKWLAQKELETLDSLHAGELEGTDALQEQADRWREIEATVPSRSITVPDDCAASPITTLPTRAMTSLSLLWYFGRLPKDKPLLRWVHGNQADEWLATLRQLLKKHSWTQTEGQQFIHVPLDLTDHWTAPLRWQAHT